MTAPRNPDPLFQRRYFEQELIILCVRWYISYKRELLERADGIRTEYAEVSQTIKEIKSNLLSVN